MVLIGMFFVSLMIFRESFVCVYQQQNSPYFSIYQIR